MHAIRALSADQFCNVLLPVCHTSKVTTIVFVLFPNLTQLDATGPAQVFAKLQDAELVFAAKSREPVMTDSGFSIVPTHTFDASPRADVLVVPGGEGAFDALGDMQTVGFVRDQAAAARWVTSVCTGSGLLAAAGLLDGYRATSNKVAFEWATSQSDRVDWVPVARWVEDRDRWTSSGVSAGMDMALALIEHLHGSELAENVASRAEYSWHRDASWDPFATENGLAAN